MLQYVAVCCSILQYAAVCCCSSELQCAAVCCGVLQYVEVCCRLLQTSRSSWRHPCCSVSCSILSRMRDTVRCSMLQYVAVCSSELECAVVCCGMLRCVGSVLQIVPDKMKLGAPTLLFSLKFYLVAHACCSTLQHVAVCCSMLQYVAACCSKLQYVAVCSSELQCAAVCAAVFCSLLQFFVDCCRYQEARGTMAPRAVQPEIRSFRVCVLQYVAVCSSMLQYVAVCSSEVQCAAVCWENVGVCWSMLQIVAEARGANPAVQPQVLSCRACVLQYVAACYSMLQYVAVCCSML